MPFLRGAACLALLGLAGAALGRPAELDRDTVENIPHFADEIMVRHGVPGLGVAVVNAERVLYVGGLGVTEAGGSRRVDPDTVFGIGSVTKSFTAVIAEMLAEEGVVDLDRPVRTYLPGLVLQDEEATLGTTLRDLLAHRTGLPRHDAMWYRSGLDRAGLLARLRYLQPADGLREKFHYSNLMYMVAGEALGRAAGSTWEELLRQRILEPLALRHTWIHAPPPGSSEVATPHARGPGGAAVPIPFYVGREVAPATAIYSSAGDVARWLRLLLGRGTLDGHRLLPPERVEELWTPQVAVATLGEDELPLTCYGLGWFVQQYRGHLFVWHSGAVDGFVSLVALLPRDDFGVVVLTNRSDNQAADVISRWLFDRVLGLPVVDWDARLTARERARQQKVDHELLARDERQRSAGPPSIPAAGCAGTYEDPAYGTITVSDTGTGLEATFHGATGPLAPVGGDVYLFRPRGWQLREEYVIGFYAGEGGAAASLSAALDDEVPPITFTRSEHPGPQ